MVRPWRATTQAHGSVTKFFFGVVEKGGQLFLCCTTLGSLGRKAKGQLGKRYK